MFPAHAVFIPEAVLITGNSKASRRRLDAGYYTRLDRKTTSAVQNGLACIPLKTGNTHHKIRFFTVFEKIPTPEGRQLKDKTLRFANTSERGGCFIAPPT